MIGGDKIIGALFLYILQPFGKNKDGIEDVNKIGKGIDGLTDEVFHIRKFTKKRVAALLYRKAIPKMRIIKKRIEHGNRSTKNNGSDQRYKKPFAIRFKN